MGTYRASTIITVIGTVALLPIAMLPILARVTRRYGALRGWPMLAAVGLLASSVALAAFTVFPLPDPATLECSGDPLNTYWQTDLFASISLIGDARAAVGFPAVLVSSAFLQVALNVLLFVPYGFFLHQVTRWSGARVTLVGLGTSALIELTQGTAVFGLYPCPYRLLDVDDLIVNTLGTALGVLLSSFVLRFAWARPSAVPDVKEPTITRRAIAAGIDAGLVWVLAGALSLAWLAVLRLHSPDVSVPALLAELPAGAWFAAASAVVLVGAVPLLRSDRATLGQLVVNVAPTRAADGVRPPRAGSVLIRAAVRWAPIVAFAGAGLMAVAVVETVVAIARRDGLSLAGLCARTTTRTRPAIMAHMEPEVLAGGNMSGAVVRVGDTVRKPSQPQSATVQRLVAHVRAQGATWVQEPLGVDDDGRDVWRFIPGEVVHGHNPPWLRAEAILTDVARRLREWHDATATFERGPDDVWWWPGKLPTEVICHVDFAPYNHVFVEDAFVGLIDCDIAYPGPRLWDLAYTAYRYVPLTPHVDEKVPDDEWPDRTDLPRTEVLRRLGLFLDAYAGSDSRLRYPEADLLGYAVQRLVAMADWCDTRESEDLRRNGVMYRAHAVWIAAGALGAATPVTVADVAADAE